VAALPKKKPSRPYRRDRHYQQFLRYKKLTAKLQKCRKCGEPVYPHSLCMNCGTYKDFQVLDFTKRKERAKRRVDRIANQQN